MESRLTAALKRVDDLLTEHPVNGKRLALNEIKNIIQSSRAKNQWSEELESLVKKSLYLAIDLRRSKEAKNILLTYRQYCVGTNMASFDNVLGLYMDLADNRLRKAARDYNKSNEFTVSVEAEIMKQLSGDYTDGAEKEQLAPWIKFAFDAYISVMEIVRNTNLEKRYHNAAHRGFNLCKDYKKVAEFKSLSQELRKHYEQAQLHTQNLEESQKKGLFVLTQESRQNALNTRFKQISTAMELNLFQDSYRCIQDIHDIIESMEETPDKRTMKKYYNELSKVFWISKDFPLYAYTLLQLFNLTNKVETKTSIATNYLLSILSMPTTYDKSLGDADKHAKQLGLSEVLNLSHMLSREELIRDMHGVNILSYVTPAAAEAYRVLEEDFSPLDLCEKMNTLFAAFEKDSAYAQFTKPLKDATATKLIIQLSQVYDNISVDDVLAYSSGLFDYTEIERVLMKMTASNQIAATFDHESNTIIFGQGLNIFEADDFKGLLQKFNARLRAISKSLPSQKTAYRPKAVTETQLKKIRDSYNWEFTQHTRVHQFKREHAKVLEVMVEEQFEEAKLKEAEEERQLQEEEIKRLQREKEREALEAKKHEHMKQLYSQLVNTTTTEVVGKITTKKVDDLIQKKQEEIEKKKLDKEKKLAKTIKHMNYLERALRETESGLLDAAHNQEEAAAKDAYYSRIKKIKERQKRQYDIYVREHEILKEVFPFEAEFLKRSTARRTEAYNQQKAAYEAEYKAALSLWKQRREKVAHVYEENQRKKEEETAKRLQEEEEARERERIDREAREAVEEENRRKAEIALEKERQAQAEKEREASKYRRPESSAYQPAYQRPSGAYVPPSARGEPYRPSTGAYRPPYARGDRDEPSGGAYRPPYARGDRDEPSSGAYRPPYARGDRDEPSGGTYRPPYARGDRDEPSGGAYRPPYARGGDQDDDLASYRPPVNAWRRKDDTNNNEDGETKGETTNEFGDDWNVVTSKKSKGRK